MGIKGALAWRLAMEKIGVYPFWGTLAALISRLMREYEGDIERVNEEMRRIGYEVGEFIYTKFLVQFKDKPLPERKAFENYNLGFKFFLGKEFDEKIRKIEGDRGVWIFRSRNCPICKGLTVIKGLHACELFSGVIQYVEDMEGDENDRRDVVVRETKCMAGGDEYCEWIVTFKLVR